jgi:hypothetical protein
LAKLHMTPLMIEYLVAACEEIQGDIEKQVDAVALRKKLKFSLDNDRHAQQGLQYRDYITTKGAGKVPIGFFWVTEEGVRAAIREGELSRWSRFFREGWEEDASGRGLERRMRWLLSDVLEKIPDLERTPLESETLYELFTAEGWEVPAGAMDKIFEDIEVQGIIRAYTVADGDTVAKHGGRKIWAVDEDRLFD